MLCVARASSVAGRKPWDGMDDCIAPPTEDGRSGCEGKGYRYCAGAILAERRSQSRQFDECPCLTGGESITIYAGQTLCCGGSRALYGCIDTVISRKADSPARCVSASTRCHGPYRTRCHDPYHFAGDVVDRCASPHGKLCGQRTANTGSLTVRFSYLHLLLVSKCTIRRRKRARLLFDTAPCPSSVFSRMIECFLFSRKCPQQGRILRSELCLKELNFY